MLHFHFAKNRDENEARAQRAWRMAGKEGSAPTCWACGRTVDVAKHDLRAIYEASNYMAFNEHDAMTTPIEDDYWELNSVPIGPECAKKLKDHVFTSLEAARIVNASREAYLAWAKSTGKTHDERRAERRAAREAATE